MFFKLKRYSQTSLEGVHELAVTFVAPRAWQWREIQVDCAARGERKMLWMKQDTTIGQASRMVQLVEMSARPVRQLVLKPTESDRPTATTKPKAGMTVTATASKWRPALPKDASAEIGHPLDDKPVTRVKRRPPASRPKRRRAIDLPSFVTALNFSQHNRASGVVYRCCGQSGGTRRSNQIDFPAPTKR